MSGFFNEVCSNEELETLLKDVLKKVNEFSKDVVAIKKKFLINNNNDNVASSVDALAEAESYNENKDIDAED